MHTQQSSHQSKGESKESSCRNKHFNTIHRQTWKDIHQVCNSSNNLMHQAPYGISTPQTSPQRSILQDFPQNVGRTQLWMSFQESCNNLNILKKRLSFPAKLGQLVSQALDSKKGSSAIITQHLVKFPFLQETLQVCEDQIPKEGK